MTALDEEEDISLANMKVTPTPYNIMDFCAALNNRQIIANWDYQRSDEVWPPKAQSLLIDTILNGYPIPKLMIWQRVDVQNMNVQKELVDGQQRATAIRAFFNNELRLGGRVKGSGLTFGELPDDLRAKFLNYDVHTDIITGVSERVVREVFWRMNSYTVPLNPQERRHAMHYGETKYFILELSEDYGAQVLAWRTFSKKQIVRMREAEFFAEFVRSLHKGIQTHSQPSLDRFYESGEEVMPARVKTRNAVDHAMGWIIEHDELQGTRLLKRREVLLTLLLALAHVKQRWAHLDKAYKIASRPVKVPEADCVRNLLKLDSTLGLDPDDDGGGFVDLKESTKKFVLGSLKATNTVSNRRVRFKFFCRALTERQFRI